MKNKTLNDYKQNTFSHFGEDGVTKEIMRRLNISTGTCVEFGAWDGVAFSNTAILWQSGWKGVLIEASKEKFETLKKVVSGYDCLPLNDMVMSSGDGSLENILRREKIDFADVRFLSIDVDGNEYHIFDKLDSLRPSVVVMEYNPTIPPEISVVSKEDSFFGSSARAIVDLAEKKGYALVAMTKNNCFFVDGKLKEHFSDLETSFDSLTDRSTLTYLITGYRGAYAFSQSPAFSMGLPLDKEIIQKGNLHFFTHSPARIRWNYAKDAVKRIAKRIIKPERISWLKSLMGYAIWNIKGRPIPAHGLYKRKSLKRAASRHGIDTFIETGTAGGGTVLALRSHFKKLYTIELDPTLYHQGKALASTYPHIECLEGDSGIVTKSILKRLDTPALFWLDAHYSGNGTARAALDTPIIQELQSIFSHPIKRHVIVIDDIREFNGTNDYPTIEELERMIAKSAPEYRTIRDNDLLIIEPNLDATAR